MCLANGEVTRLPQFFVGFLLEVTHPPINTIVFQILKILVGGFFPIPQPGGVLTKTRNNKICYFGGGCFIFVINQ
jgi:hypothetical protein